MPLFCGLRFPARHSRQTDAAVADVQTETREAPQKGFGLSALRTCACMHACMRENRGLACLHA